MCFARNTKSHLKNSQIVRGVSMKKAEEKLLKKQLIFKAWTGILLVKGVIDPVRYNRMMALIEKMRK